MKFGLSNNNVDSIVNVLKRFEAIDAAYLYGSRAKGNYRQSSDIDLMLKGEKLGLAQLAHIMTDLDDLMLPYQFDVAIYHQVDNPELLEHINRVGVELYGSAASIP